MGCLLAVLTRCDNLILLVPNMHLMQRCIKVIPGGSGALVVKAEYGVISQPTSPSKFASLPRQAYLPLSLGEPLPRLQHMLQRNPRHQCSFTPYLPLTIVVPSKNTSLHCLHTYLLAPHSKLRLLVHSWHERMCASTLGHPAVN